MLKRKLDWLRWYLVFSCIALPGTEALADKSTWELGIGLSVLNIPFYPGAAESRSYIVPVPHASLSL
jgi:hypothetical protein